MKLCQEIYQFLLVSQQYIQNRFRLIWVGNENLRRVIKVSGFMIESKINDRNIEIGSTLNTWKASNWMFLDFSFSMFIISFKLSGLEMYRVITYTEA